MALGVTIGHDVGDALQNERLWIGLGHTVGLTAGIMVGMRLSTRESR